ncbi:hypothetical protein [Pseudomonas syringae]|uniref:hypothetical protein n=1 Tax=Pseudomonas syringae TaxID=317 RepID=UPI003204BE4E
MSKELKCWSCKAVFTLSEHGNCDGCCWKCGVEIDLHEMDIHPADQQGEQMARMPVERCYDVRAKMIIAFNEAKKSGGDLDDQLDAAYKSALRFSPNPDAQPATGKVVLPERKLICSYEDVGFNECLDEVAKLNGIES